MSETEKGPDREYASYCMRCGVFVKMKLTTAETYPKGGKLADSLCDSCNENWLDESRKRMRQRQKTGL